MSTQRKRLEPSEAKTAKGLSERLFEDKDYLAQLDEALEEFKEGKEKTFEGIEVLRRRRRLQSGN